MKLFTILILCLMSLSTQAQNSSDYYYQIPDYPGSFTAANAVSRLVDGLGFRYYWATEGLRPEDLDYKPSPEARTTKETLDHIYGMSKWVLGTLDPNIEKPQEEENMSFAEKREATLKNYENTSKALLAMSDEELSKIRIKSSNGSELQFWNHINGPVSDALWHVGQVVSFRRASGNPLNGKVSMFTGKLRD